MHERSVFFNYTIFSGSYSYQLSCVVRIIRILPLVKTIIVHFHFTLVVTEKFSFLLKLRTRVIFKTRWVGNLDVWKPTIFSTSLSPFSHLIKLSLSRSPKRLQKLKFGCATLALQLELYNLSFTT